MYRSCPDCYDGCPIHVSFMSSLGGHADDKMLYVPLPVVPICSRIPLSHNPLRSRDAVLAVTFWGVSAMNSLLVILPFFFTCMTAFTCRSFRLQSMHRYQKLWPDNWIPLPNQPKHIIDGTLCRIPIHTPIHLECIPVIGNNGENL